MSALISSVSLKKIRARSVLSAGNIHNGGIRDRLAVAVNNLPCNTRSVCAYYYVQVRLGKNRETRIGHIPPVEIDRSEEHTSELQSQSNLVCRLLLEKKKAKV